MRNLRRVLAAFALSTVTVLSAWGAPEAELKLSGSTLARMNVGMTSIDWLPAVAFERAVLTVAGPDGVILRQETETGQTLSLSLFDTKGNRLPDGIYTWELRAIPPIDPETREAVRRARDGGDENALKLLKEMGKLPERPLLQSGNFSVKDGSFAAVKSSKPADSKIKNITGNDILETGKLVAQGNVCFGGGCTSLAQADFPALKLRGPDVNILFDDQELPETFPPGSTRKWALRINPSGSDQFTLFDVDATTTPLRIAGGAPDSSLSVASSGNVGLGTVTPGARLEVQGDTSANVWGTTFSDTQQSQLALRRARGNSAAATAVQSGDGLGSVSFRGYTGSGFSFNGALIGAAAEETWTAGANGTRIFFSTTPSGTTTQTPRVMIKNDGKVGIGTLAPSSLLHVNGGDIRVSGGSFIDDGVTLNAPDYVFEPDYSLMPIEKLRDFVAREKRLPNVPSAREIKGQGLNLGQFQMRLLEKVEELTLYTLTQDERIKAQQEQIAGLLEHLAALEKNRPASAPQVP
jgi:hypothetical protein